MKFLTWPLVVLVMFSVLVMGTIYTRPSGTILVNALANRVVVTDASINLTTSSANNTELGYIAGATNSIQAQINHLNTLARTYQPFPQIRLTWGPGTVAANATTTKTATFTGLKKGEPLTLAAPTDLGNGLLAMVQCTASDFAKITVINPTTNSIAGGAGNEWVISRSISPPSRIAFPSAELQATNLVAQYDMVTITAVTNLTDLSGRGNTGIITSASASSAGLVFNGSSSRVDIPALVGNTNFTILILANAPNNTGFAWSENGDPQSDNSSLGMNAAAAAGGGLTRIYGNAGGIQIDWSTLITPSYSSGWHLYCLQRHEGYASFGVLDQNFVQSRSLGNITSLATTIGTIGARRSTASTAGSYWTGTNAYTIIWAGTNGCLSKASLSSAYKFIQTAVTNRGIYLPDQVESLYPGGVWQRQGAVLSSPSALANEKVLYTTTDCQIVSNPGFLMVVDKGSVGIMYTESKDGLNWSPLTGPILTGVNQPGWVYETNSGKYYLSASSPVGGTGTNVNVYISPSHTPNSYSLLVSNIVTSASLGQTYINNTGINEYGGTMYMLLETSPGGLWGATASSPYTNWVASTHSFDSNPDVLNGPMPWFINGIWYSWGHNVAGIYRRQSSTWDSSWQRSCPSCQVLTGLGLFAFSPNAGDEASQLATPCLVEDGSGRTFLYYCASVSSVLSIKCAIANMTMAELVRTGEGTAEDWP